MCGIAGYISNEETIDPRLSIALPLLGVFMTDRGRQSWGWSNGTDVDKHMGEVRSMLGPNHLGHKQAIIHTRQATFGANIAENSHPFNIKGVLGVHNGMVYNHKEIAEKYGIDYKVDSEIIFHQLAEGRDMSELQGYGAIAFWRDGIFNIGRFNNGDMALANTEFGWVFASTEKALADALGMSGLHQRVKYQVDLKQGNLYQLIGDKIVKTRTKLSVSKAKTGYQPQWQDYGYKTNNYGGYKSSVPMVTSGPANQLPLPTAATTTFKALSPSTSAQKFHQDFVDEYEGYSEGYDDSAFGTALTPMDRGITHRGNICDWCGFQIIGIIRMLEGDEICLDCYEAVLDAEADEAEDQQENDEQYEALMSQYEEGDEETEAGSPDDTYFNRFRPKFNPNINSTDFTRFLAYEVSRTKGTICKDCNDELSGMESVYLCDRDHEFSICGPCFRENYLFQSRVPAVVSASAALHMMQ